MVVATSDTEDNVPEKLILLCDDPQYCVDCGAELKPLGVMGGSSDELMECTCPQCGQSCLCPDENLPGNPS